MDSTRYIKSVNIKIDFLGANGYKRGKCTNLRKTTTPIKAVGREILFEW